MVEEPADMVMKIMSYERPVALLFSGGKDSNYVYIKLKELGYDVCCLMSVVPEDPESKLLHAVNTMFTVLQGEALGKPVLLEVAKAGEEEEAVGLLMERAKGEYGAAYAGAGAIVSRWQKEVFGRLAAERGLEPLAPIWGVDQAEYIRDIARRRIRAMITRVSAYGLGQELLGTVIDDELAERIVELSRRYGFNPSFDGGEAETFVLDAPPYEKEISITKAERVTGHDWGEIRILEAKVENKART